MHFKKNNFDILGYPLSDNDPRMNKEWISNHIDEIKAIFPEKEYSIREGLSKLNEKYNLNVDYEDILDNLYKIYPVVNTTGKFNE